VPQAQLHRKNPTPKDKGKYVLKGTFYGADIDIMNHPFLVPETSTVKWLFQLDESKSLQDKWVFHQTSISNWLFRVPASKKRDAYFNKLWLFEVLG